jgi:mannose-1-phosphate guanylyltransferase/phosphomannomutase
LTNDEALVLLLSLLINSNRFTSSHRPVIALPVAASRAAEEICKNVGGQILWTKLSDAHLMETANLRENKVDFAASQAGGFIFPRFLPAYDAVATLVNLLELLSSAQMKISDILSAIPAKAAIVHKGVVTPITQKGAVMRSLMERVKNKKLVLIDGIKIIEDDTWVLIVPDPEDPITHIWAEASSMAHATTLRDRYATLIEQFVS